MGPIPQVHGAVIATAPAMKEALYTIVASTATRWPTREQMRLSKHRGAQRLQRRLQQQQARALIRSGPD
ncbi:hypothetical protein ACFX2K_009293 [Malus domestica]